MAYKSSRSSTDPFTHLLFNALLGFTFLFFIAIMFMNPIKKTGIINPKAEYIITLAWPQGNPDDIDLWVEGPEGNLVWFRNPEAGLLHLDRDDRGELNDILVIEGRTIVNPLNQEIVTLRGVVPGEYVVNLHYYESHTKNPVKATLKVERINPALEIAWYGTILLEGVGTEKTALRFKISPDGSIRETNTLAKTLVRISR